MSLYQATAFPSLACLGLAFISSSPPSAFAAARQNIPILGVCHDASIAAWEDQMLDYNIPRGKLNRGLAILETYKLLKEGDELSEEEIFLACVLGWCSEWMMAKRM